MVICMFVYGCEHMYICMYMDVYICLGLFMCVCIQVYICSYIYLLFISHILVHLYCFFLPNIMDSHLKNIFLTNNYFHLVRII